MTDSWDNETIWRLLRAGRVDALEHVVQQFWTPLVAYVTHTVADQDTAEDIVQEVLRRFWDRRERWTPKAPPEVVLFRMARNATIDLRRTNKRRDAAHLRLAGDAKHATAPHASTYDLERAIRMAIARLPIARREVFLLVRMTSLSYSEIAELLDLKPQTVANHMRLALVDLRAALKEHV